jgi:hypothetical protein
MILNEPTYRLFRPDLANPTRADFEEGPPASKRRSRPSSPRHLKRDLYLVGDAGRYVTASRTS